MYNVIRMAYKALYRTYRPTTFDEVVGQEHIVRTLKNALKENKIAHAYLFAGPRGTGKTTMAKLLAKALNCEEGIGQQCNKCSNCQAINEVSHPDVIEIDAASNNGVDEVRDLIDRVRYLPIKGRYKVYIIDEVHMMTSGAFNALLRTLEEPPSHVIFILATTEPHKILPTILSRCQRYDFAKVSDKDIKKRLTYVLEEEQVSYEEEAIDMIISLADGGMRDALSILDQLLAYSGHSLTSKDVLDVFALTSKEEKLRLVDFIMHGDVGETLKMFREFVEHGNDIRKLLSDLLDIIKDIYTYRVVGDPSLLLVLTEKEALKFENLANEEELLTMSSTLLDAQSEMKNVANARSLLEISLLKLTNLKHKYPQKPSELEDEFVVVKKEVEEVKPVKEEKPIVQEVKVEPEVEEEKPLIKGEETTSQPMHLFNEDEIIEDSNNFEPEESYHIGEEMIINAMIKGDKELKKKIISLWDELNKYLSSPTLGKYASLLKDARPYIATKELLFLEYDLDLIANRVNLKNNQKTISNLIQKISGRQFFVYALTRAETIAYVKKFRDLSQLGKLKKADEVTLDLKEIK